MRNLIFILLVIGSIIGFGYMASYADYIPQSGKDLSNCDPTDTVGSCSDKCPDGQYKIGVNKDTGAIVCDTPPETNPVSQAPAVSPVVSDYVAPASVPGFSGK